MFRKFEKITIRWIALFTFRTQPTPVVLQEIFFVLFSLVSSKYIVIDLIPQDGASKLIRNHLKKANSNAKLFTSSSLDEADANPPHSPGRLGYRSIPPAVPRQSTKEEELVPGSPLHGNSRPDILQREGSTTSLHSNDSSDSIEGKKIQGNHMENSPSITSSGYHSDEIHASDTAGVNGDNSPPRVSGPASPSLSTSSVSGYDATRYQDETSTEATLPSVRILYIERIETGRIF